MKANVPNELIEKVDISFVMTDSAGDLGHERILIS